MNGFDPVIHAPLRLRLCSLLSPVEEAEFAMLRDRLGVADSVLSKHVATLADAGYVKVAKSASGGRRTTWISLTRPGRRALEGHLAALREIIDASGAG
ncbi:MAG: transcriptional regulator [Thermoleophilia bacterium]